MDCSMPSFPVPHYLPEFTQTHVHDAIQPSRPLSPPSPPALNLSQHQGLLQWLSLLHQVAKNIGASASASVLPMNIQGWFPWGWTGLISLQSLKETFKGTFKSLPQHDGSKIISSFGAQPSLWCSSHVRTWPLEKPQLGLDAPLSAEWCLCFWICCLALS